MRIVIVVETFAKDMGYINNTLPKYLTRLGEDVHVITTDLAPYHQLGSANTVFGKDFASRNANSPNSISLIDGYHLHTLPHKKVFGYPKPIGLGGLLSTLQPDIVCIFQAAGWIPLLCAFYKNRLQYKLIIGSHMGKTVFSLPSSVFSFRRLRSFMLRTVPGWYFSSKSEHCVVPTVDAAQVVSDHFGISSRIVRVMNLPADTDFFYPANNHDSDRRAKPSGCREIRRALGVEQDEILCVYSGKFTKEKNPVVLAQAVAKLRLEGERVRAMFIGAGEQEDELKSIVDTIVLPFMPIDKLADYYRGSDIGVWMNESISFLDAACCGLPLLLSDTVKDISHVQEFSATYRTNDPVSLAGEILLLLAPAERARQSELAGRLGHDRFSGMNYAVRRQKMFIDALATNKMSKK